MDSGRLIIMNSNEIIIAIHRVEVGIISELRLRYGRLLFQAEDCVEVLLLLTVL